MQMARSRKVTLALATINGLLALTLWLQISAGPREVTAALPDAPRRTVQAGLPAPLPTLPPLSAYQELSERPLFWSERRLLQDNAAVAAEAVPAGMPFVLLGVVTAEQSHALLGKNGAKEVTRVHLGDVAEGWRVEAMTPDGVTLVANGVRHDLKVGTSRSNGK